MVDTDTLVLTECIVFIGSLQIPINVQALVLMEKQNQYTKMLCTYTV